MKHSGKVENYINRLYETNKMTVVITNINLLVNEKNIF